MFDPNGLVGINHVTHGGDLPGHRRVLRGVQAPATVNPGG